MAADLPKTFKRGVFKENGGPLTVEVVDLTLPRKGEVLVKVQACGVCYSDRFVQVNGMGGGFPLVPGHEYIGHVAAVGPEESIWKVGDRIGGTWHGGHDNTCNACKKGLHQMCDNGVVNGETTNGGYAQYCKLRSEAGVRIPEGVDAAEYAPIMCAGVATFNSMRLMNIPAGSTVAVQGIGGLGHLAIQYANKFGYRVVALSRSSEKEDFARGLGAHEYIDTSKGDPGAQLKALGGAALILTTAPSGDAISPLLTGLSPCGKLLILAVAGDITVNTGLMLHYGLSIHTWPSGHAVDVEDAIAFTNLQNIKCLVETWPLENAKEAFEAMMNGTARFRAVIRME